MSFARQVKRNQDKRKRKNANKAAKEIKQLMDAMPNGCVECGAEFNPREHPEQLDEWSVKVSPGSAKLTCPDCLVKSAEDDAA